MVGTAITTLWSHKIDFLAPDPRQIDIRDIGHSLAGTWRFRTHMNKFYSVAEHCFNVSILCSRLGENPLWGLLHDAEEAYTSDIPSPMKEAVRILCKEAGIDPLRMVQDKLTMAIAAAYGLPGGKVPLGVKKIDYELLLWEGLNLTNGNWPPKSEIMAAVQEIPLTCLPKEDAEALFYERFNQLRGR